MMKRKEKTVYTECVISETGEQINVRTINKGNSEPEYVKLYIDCVFTLKGLRKGLSPIFLALLPHMSYANMEDDSKVDSGCALNSSKLNAKPRKRFCAGEK